MTNQSVTMEAVRPPRQRLKDIRPQQLLDAALALFVEKGFTATRSEEVAHHAGVSKGTLYLYYPSKEELFKAVVRQNISALIVEGSEIVATFPGTSSELLLRLFEVWWDRVAESQAGGLHKVVLAEVRNFPELAQFYADEVIVPAHRLFESVVRRGNDPYPPREALPIELPDVLAAQVAAAQQEMVEAGEPGFEDVPAYGAEEHDGGALDQLSQATVVNADDEDFDDRAGYDDPAAYEDDGEAGAQGGPEPSSGSAMQRLRRRSWRR